jgi:radical SAM protein with 4Fe4S-binding SPASM domain
MIESVARHNPFISIWGGEPLMYDGIMDVIDTAHKHDLRVGMITNGIYLKKYASQLAKYDNFSLGISLDGPPLIHDKVRGRTGTFINLVEGVNAFNGQRRKLGKQPKRVSIIFSTVTQDNMYRIEDLIKTAEQFCPDAMYISYLTFVTRDMIDATNRIFQHKFGITYSSLESFNIDVSGYDIAHLEEMTRKMNNKQFTDKFNVHFNPHIKPEDVRRYYTDTRYAMGRQTCYRPWFIAEMLPNGQMNFCPDFPDYKFGDIRKESFADIWNGKQARRFRRLLKKKKLFPMCYRCCGLLTHQPRSVLNP